MNYLDIIIGIILIIFGIRGLTKGIINEVASLAALVVGLYGMFYFSDITANYLKDLIDIKPEYIATISFLLTFIIFVVIIKLAGKLLSSLLSSLSLGWLDKMGGLVFGVLKGSLITSLLIMLMNVMNISGTIPQEVRDNSLLYRPVEQTAPYLYKNFKFVRDAVDKSKELLDNNKDDAKDVSEQKPENNFI